MSATIDNQVLLEFQTGNHAAFQRVFEIYYPRLFVFAHKLIESSDEAEDIAVIAFHKLFGICSKFETEVNIRAFLYIAVRNSCLSYLRHRKTKSIQQRVLAEKMQSDVLLSYEYEIRDELYEKVQAAIENLPEECRKIFKMLYIDELKPSEIAEILKIAPSTVYNQKQNALKALRLTLGENSLVLTWILYMLVSIEKQAINKFHHLSA